MRLCLFHRFVFVFCLFFLLLLLLVFFVVVVCLFFVFFLSYEGKMIVISSTQTTYVFNLCMY